MVSLQERCPVDRGVEGQNVFQSCSEIEGYRFEDLQEYISRFFSPYFLTQNNIHINSFYNGKECACHKEVFVDLCKSSNP